MVKRSLVIKDRSVMKKSKKAKGKSAGAISPKPYTVKQENDIALGKAMFWLFILSFPVIGLIGLLQGSMLFLLWGILSILFATYHLLGLILKWDHARICAKHLLCKKYKYDIRNAWSREDTKDIIIIIILCGIFGAMFITDFVLHF